MPKRKQNTSEKGFVVEEFTSIDGPDAKRWRPWRSGTPPPTSSADHCLVPETAVTLRPETDTVPTGCTGSAVSDAGKPVPHYYDNTMARAEIIPLFDPEKPDLFAYQWIQKIEQLSVIHNWSDSTRSYFMQSRLGGMARTWHASLPNYNLTWSEWKAELLKAFPYNIDYAESLRDMLSRKKGLNESMAQYFYQKNALLTRLDIWGEKAVACIIDGLPPHMKAPARAGNFATPTDFYSKFLAMMEDKPKFNNQPIRPRTEQPRSDGDINNVNQNRDVRKPITCFLCNEPGHTVRRCPKNASRPTCTTCGKVGHSSEKCWSRSGAGVIPPVPSTTPINIISPEVNETYFRDVTIDDVNVRAYFDSGAKINVASLEFSKQLRSPLLPCDYVVAGFGGGTVLAKGQHHVTLKIKDIEFSTTLVIVDSDMRNPQVILGQPIINDPNIKFIVTGNTLHIEKTQEDPFTEIMMIDDIHLNSNRIEVRCKEDTIVPPQTRLIVNVQCVGIIEDSVVFIESRTCLCDYRDYSIPSALFSGKGGALQVCNRSETPLLLEKGTLLARGLQCADAVYELVDGTLESRAEYQILAIDIDKVQCACSSEAETKLIKLLEEYADCFSSNTEELGCTDKIKMKIELNSDKPICYRPYRLSEAEKAVVREKISDLTRNNIIRESTSPFSSPIVLVKKKDGDYRLCVDYRKLNSITVKDRYPLPIIEEQVEKLGGKRFFTNLDMSQGFYQIPLEKESIPKTGFSTPEGHYEFLRMPFGLANSPSVYQRLMDTILGSLRHEQVLPYMDDLLIASESETEALETLRIVLAIIRDAKLTLNLSKCRFLQKEVQYLGYEISEIGIRPGTKKLEAVSKYKEPTNIHELRMFLGLTSYFRKFVKGYALIAHDLYKLLKKNEPWMWGKLQQNAFNELKEILTTGPVLALYNCKAETEVHTDASSKGVAGILLQRNGGEMRPVAYFSRKTSREEAFYHSYELECLAVVESLKRFRIYLAGIDFKVVTDCAAVRQTFEKRDLLPRIARWWLSIQEYTFTIVHRPGTTHKHVDALSRAPTDDSISASVLVLDLMDWIVCMQNQDPKICIIRDKLEHKENDPDVQNNYVLLDNKVYRKCCNDQLRLVIPKYCKWNIMRKYHDDVGHPGLKKCDALIKENCWFSGMTRFIRKYVNGCLDCAYKRGQYGKHEGELHPIEKADKPMDTLHIDHAGPFCKSKKGNSYLFVIVDAFTKFVWAKPCRTTKTAEVIEKLMEVFSEFGYPRRIISDSGTAFTSKSFREFCVRNQIKHVKNAVASPRSNGQVERYNRTLIEAINKSTNDEREWDFCLSKVMWGTNNTLNSTTGFTPYRLMFQASRSLFQGMGFNVADTDQCARENAEKAKKNIDKTALSMKKRFDAKRKRPTQYKVNELVLWQKSDTGSKDVRRKLKEKFSGPYKIKKCLGNDRYLISALKGLKGYKKFTAVVASDALRKFVEGKDSDTESNDSDVDSTEELIDLLEG